MSIHEGSKGLAASDKWARFALATLAFLAFEAFLLAVFGDYFFEGVSSDTGLWMMIALAACGYLAYGYLAGSGLSALFVLVPIIVAIALGSDIPVDADGREPLTLGARWMLFSVIFIPAYVIGLGAYYLRARRSAG